MTQLASKSTMLVTYLIFGLVLPAAAQPPCDPIPEPSGPVVEVLPSQSASLRAVVAAAAEGTTILLHPGAYDMSLGDSNSRLVFDTNGVTLRSLNGDRDSVILDGAYQTNELISIYASNVTIADLTLRRAYDHPVHINGTAGISDLWRPAT